jgi:restriction system protein
LSSGLAAPASGVATAGSNTRLGHAIMPLRMALWLVRTGRQGQHLQKFLSDNRIYLTWGGLSVDLSATATKADLGALLASRYDFGAVKLANHTGQIWRFVREMQPGDWVVVPDKTTGAINVAEVTSDYVAVPQGPDPYFHYRAVKWIAQDVPRTKFGKDLLFSFGGLMTCYRVSRNNAEARLKAMAAKNWASEVDGGVAPGAGGGGDEGDESPDLEQLASDEIARLIMTRFKGHGFARLVEAVLRAQGYTTWRSSEGADKGVDILAGSGALGFGEPRICVQVKSSDSPVDRPTLDQLIGTMQNMGAQQGLLVSWGGFRSSVRNEEPPQFFRVRLWDQQKLLDELLAVYEHLDEDIRADLPLKRIWIITRNTAEDASAAAEPEE